MKKLSIYILLLIQIGLTTDLFGQYTKKLDVSTLDNPYPGYLLVDWPPRQNFSGVDNYGYFVEEKTIKSGSEFYYQFKNGNLAQFAYSKYYIYNSNMQLIDSVPNPTEYELDYHDFIMLSNGHYLIIVNEMRQIDMSKLITDGKTNALVINNILVETDRNGTIYWTWSSLDHLNILDATRDVDPRLNTIDYAHINGLFEDANGNILISIRHFDEISLINKSTGDFIWRMGGSDCKNNQFTFISDSFGGYTGFSHQHTPCILPNGNILLFDNGNMRSTPVSRAVEYSVNYSSKSATKVWEYRNTPDLYNFAMGSAYRLPNGNTLINWSGYIIKEVKPDNSIALEITSLESYPVYRAMKVKLGLKYASQFITNSGEYNYSGPDGNTGAKVLVSYISKSTQTYLQKHNYPPHSGSYNENMVQSLLPYRWVLTAEEISNIQGTIKISTSTLSNIEDPNKLVIYKRSTEGTGDFQVLTTTYNSGTGEISATFTGWGEFVIGSLILNAPKLLTPQNATFVTVEDELTWTSVFGATSYAIEISKKENFSSDKISAVVNNTKYRFVNLDFNSKYFWRVKSLNSNDESVWSEVRYFTTSVETPKLESPAHESFGIRNIDTLKWNKVVGAEKYHLQVSLDDHFLSPLINESNVKNNNFKIHGLGYNLKYYWRVKAINSASNSLWSEVFSFTSVIASPMPTSPADLAKNINLTQKFTWDIVDGAEKYLFEIAHNETFSTIFKQFDNLNGNTIEINNLEYEHTYFWRVKAARDTDTSDWSPKSQFMTLLNPVSLQSPKNNSTKVIVNTLLTWSEQTTGVKFKLQVGTDYNFVQNEIDIDELSENSFQIDELKPNTQYVWRVMASRDDNISDWSDVWTFTTGIGFALQAPKLLLPKDKAETFADVTIHWNKRVNALKYRLQISLNEEFNSFVYDNGDIGESFISIDGLQNNKNYFWRVKAYSKYDSSKWSETWQFHVSKGNKVVELYLPGNDDLQIPLDGNLEWKKMLDADYYTVQLADNSDFMNPILFEDVHDTVIIAYPKLNYNTLYYWRVRFLKMGYISDWSDTWTFTTRTPLVLDIPIIQSHRNGMTGIPIEGTIKWESVKNAAEYQISLSNQRNFSTVYYKQTGIKGTELAYSELDYGTLYFIRASASNESSKSSWSVPIEITTELEAPAIQYPRNGDTNIASAGQISWFLNNDYYWYHIQISENMDFNDLIVDKNNFDEKTFEYTLADFTKYYCRVKTYNDTNFSRWSHVVSFTTQNPSSVSNEDIHTDELTIFPNPANDFINVENQDAQNELNISITDLIGKEYIRLVNNSSRKIDISQLPQGMYIIKAGNQSRLFVKID